RVERGPDCSPAAEGGVESPIGGVARQGQVAQAGDLVVARDAGGQDLAVGLKGQGEDDVLDVPEVGGDQTARPEGGVEGAVGVVAGQTEVLVGEPRGD